MVHILCVWCVNYSVSLEWVQPFPGRFLSRSAGKTWVRFGSIKRRIPYKTVYYRAGLSKKNHQHSNLPVVSGTRGRRFKSSQAAQPALVRPCITVGTFVGTPPLLRNVRIPGPGCSCLASVPLRAYVPVSDARSAWSLKYRNAPSTL